MVTGLAENVEHFRWRVVQDALSEATAAYWRRRADLLEWAMPRPDEYRGQATPDELRDRWRRLRDEAEACRNRARVAELGAEKW